MFKWMDDKYTQLNENYKELNENVTNMKRNQEEMKNDIAAIKNTLEGLNSRLEEAEDCISELEDKVGKNTQTQLQLERRLKKQEESLRELWDNTKRNIRKIGIQEGEEEKQGIENLFEEIMTENFPDIDKKKTMQVQEVHRVPNKLNPKRPTPGHIIIKLANTNDKGTAQNMAGVGDAVLAAGSSGGAAGTDGPRRERDHGGMVEQLFKTRRWSRTAPTGLWSKDETWSTATCCLTDQQQERSLSGHCSLKRALSLYEDVASRIDNYKAKAPRHSFLIRHSPAPHGCLPEKDRTLTPRGREQAELTGLRLASLGLRFNKIVHSSMTCAVETADTSANTCQVSPAPTCRGEAPPWSLMPPSPWKLGTVRYHEDGAGIEAAFRNTSTGQGSSSRRTGTRPPPATPASSLPVCGALWFPPEGRLCLSLNVAASPNCLPCQPGRPNCTLPLGCCLLLPPASLVALMAPPPPAGWLPLTAPLLAWSPHAACYSVIWSSLTNPLLAWSSMQPDCSVIWSSGLMAAWRSGLGDTGFMPPDKILRS
ncbi:LOW QUALITY PROTEIN: hypothetical protein QTO34_017354 [Cnephaeus nilssonii]|uniref:L1 transposable element RRM domain-containing protein n=1 Tax=Cnephaeus nilssonii TaxID=3371016 RepID=A0AA40I0X4_CNENI|nr:LOW QUALITY PROTEIN: hypothetical protein QTO34_017354 [Eptesicus nilssonii]